MPGDLVFVPCLRELAKGFNPKFAELTTLNYQFLKVSYYIFEAGGDPYLVLIMQFEKSQLAEILPHQLYF